jgi:hypothetical protein
MQEPLLLPSFIVHHIAHLVTSAAAVAMLLHWPREELLVRLAAMLL